jgi:hypothetical protein
MRISDLLEYLTRTLNQYGDLPVRAFDDDEAEYDYGLHIEGRAPDMCVSIDIAPLDGR